jgi:GntR family transcriptional regulator, transcriptional repressor for pyruvate dehydrogenase complex
MFRKIKETRIYEDIADQILEAILRGDLKPTDKLPSENELGQIFGVSRVTVREAIRSLEQMGILEVRQGSRGGSYIREIVLDDVAIQIGRILRMTNMKFFHLAEARSFLEQMALRKLKSARIDDLDFEELDSNISTAETHFRNGRHKKRLLADFHFHAKIAEMTDNPIIILMHKTIVDLSMFFFEKVTPTNSMIEKTLEDHRKIVDLMKKGDFEQACEFCAEHIQEVSSRILEKSKGQSLLKKK